MRMVMDAQTSLPERKIKGKETISLCISKRPPLCCLLTITFFWPIFFLHILLQALCLNPPSLFFKSLVIFIMHFLQILSFSALLFPFAAAAPQLKKYVSPSTGKHGLAFNDIKNAQFFHASNSSPISWAYNWASSLPSGQSLPAGLRYIPMLWNAAPGAVAAWRPAVQKAQTLGADALLSFNEPDLCCAGCGSACMSIADSVAGYKANMQPFAGALQLGAPAVTNGGGPDMGLGWLDQFLTACGGCTVDFVALHYYGPADQPKLLQDHVARAYQQFGKPVWVTEYGTNGGTPAEVLSWLQTVVPWLDSQP